MLGVLYHYIVAGGGSRAAVDAGTGPVSDALAHAAVNGAIFAVAVAALSGYALVIFQSIDRAVTEIVTEANEIPNPMELTAKVSDVSLDGVSRNELHNVVQLLVSGPWEINIGGLQIPRGENLPRRGRLLIHILQDLLYMAPFHREERFVGVDDVRPWLPSVIDALHPFEMAFSDWSPQSTNYVESLIDAIATEHLDKVGLSEEMLSENPELREFAQSFGTMDRRVFETLRRHYLEISMHTKNLETKIQHLDTYRARVVPSKGLLLVIIASLVAVFGGGVAAPMLDAGTPNAVSAWVPVSIYSVWSVVAIAWALRKATRYPVL
jgi:hypothetical protein